MAQPVRLVGRGKDGAAWLHAIAAARGAIACFTGLPGDRYRSHLAGGGGRLSTITLTSERIAERCRGDGEFRLTARYWDGSLTLNLGDSALSFEIRAGEIHPAPAAPADITIRAPHDVWDRILAAVPPPRFNDIMPARAFGLVVDGDDEMFCQYYPAIRRLVDLIREEGRR